jgi:glucose/arabinose dehydrogenase
MRHRYRMAWSAGILFGLALVQGQARAQLTAGDPADNFVLQNWVTGLNSATDVAWLNDGRAIVIRKTGQVVLLDWQGNVLNPLAASLTVDTASEKGLLGVVVDDQNNIYFYASIGSDTANKHKVLKARAVGNDVVVDLANPLVSQGLEGPSNHDGGGLIIHEGQLYISVGDTGANDTPPRNRYGACLNRANGKILRINLDGSVPADNPLVGLAMATGCTDRTTGNYQLLAPDHRIYAWGLRNPWRFWIDPKTDLLWIGDVGEETQEEVTVGGKGIHHGWPFEEGTQKYAGLGGLTTCTEMTPSTPCTAPQDTHGSRNPSGAVTGGLVPPEGCGWGAYEGRYFFGDYKRGSVWTLDLNQGRSGAVAGSRKDFATLGGDSIVSFRNGPDGAMYLVSYSQGSVRRVAPKNLAPACQAVPVDAGVPPPDARMDAPVDAARDAAGVMDAADAPSGSGGAGGTGGTGGSGGTGGGGRGGSGGTAGAGNVKPGSADDGGCSCHLGGARAGAGSGWVLGLAAAAGQLGRRARRGLRRRRP